jgi:hypothetical protein
VTSQRGRGPGKPLSQDLITSRAPAHSSSDIVLILCSTRRPLLERYPHTSSQTRRIHRTASSPYSPGRDRARLAQCRRHSFHHQVSSFGTSWSIPRPIHLSNKHRIRNHLSQSKGHWGQSGGHTIHTIKDRHCFVAKKRERILANQPKPAIFPQTFRRYLPRSLHFPSSTLSLTVPLSSFSFLRVR